MMIAVATLGIESAAFGERFKKGGLPAAVFAEEEGNVGPKREIDSLSEGADVERMSGRIDPVVQTYDAAQKRRAHDSFGGRGRPTPRLHPWTLPEWTRRCVRPRVSRGGGACRRVHAPPPRS